jgi:hypothetical protein
LRGVGVEGRPQLSAADGEQHELTEALPRLAGGVVAELGERVVLLERELEAIAVRNGKREKVLSRIHLEDVGSDQSGGDCRDTSLVGVPLCGNVFDVFDVFDGDCVAVDAAEQGRNIFLSDIDEHAGAIVA